MNDKVLDTIEQMVAIQGGVSEWTDTGNLEVLLPKKVASALKIAELVTFTNKRNADSSNNYFVTYNCDILSRLEELLDRSGCIASFKIKYDGYLK